MNKLVSEFKNLTTERNMPLNERELENNQLLFTGSFRLEKARSIPFGLVIDGTEDKKIVDYQVMYNKIAYLTNFGKKDELLDYLNNLNALKSGYYHFVLRDDGEVYLRMLSRASEADVKVLYELLIFGGNIAQKVNSELQKFVNDLNGGA